MSNDWGVNEKELYEVYKLFQEEHAKTTTLIRYVLSSIELQDENLFQKSTKELRSSLDVVQALGTKFLKVVTDRPTV